MDFNNISESVAQIRLASFDKLNNTGYFTTALMKEFILDCVCSHEVTPNK